MKTIGIIGRGFVGSAVEFGFSAQTGCDAVVKVYDKNPKLSSHTLEETVSQSQFIFVSVPTPSNSNGSINLDIIHDVLLYSGGYPFRNIQKQRLNCTSTFSIESGIAFANNEMAFFACFKKEFGPMHDSVYNY